MTPSQATGYTPFFMVYGFEAILSTDLDYGAPRVRAYDEQGVEASLEDAMDQLDEAAMSPSSTRPSTSKHCAGTIAVGCGVRPSTSGT